MVGRVGTPVEYSCMEMVLVHCVDRSGTVSWVVDRSDTVSWVVACWLQVVYGGV